MIKTIEIAPDILAAALTEVLCERFDIGEYDKYREFQWVNENIIRDFIKEYLNR